MQEHLKDYPITIEIPIAWGEMDAFQHVNNVVYFRYFESARIAYFKAIDMMKIMKTTGVGPILASTQCRFKLPLTYPDTVTVGCRVSSIEEDRFLMEYLVVSHNHQAIAAKGEGLIVSFNYQENKKAALPASVKDKIQMLEK